jgi:hypothetical protein
VGVLEEPLKVAPGSEVSRGWGGVWVGEGLQLCSYILLPSWYILCIT